MAGLCRSQPARRLQLGLIARPSPLPTALLSARGKSLCGHEFTLELQPAGLRRPGAEPGALAARKLGWPQRREAGALAELHASWLHCHWRRPAPRSAHRLGAAAAAAQPLAPAHAATMKPARRSFFTKSTLDDLPHQLTPTSELCVRHGATTWARPGAPTGTTDLALLPDGRRRGPRPASCSLPSSFAASALQPAAAGPSDLRACGAGRRRLPCEDLRELGLRRLRGHHHRRNSPAVRRLSAWSQVAQAAKSVDPGDQRCMR